jgi:Family of unknown function (DUF6644)
MMHMLYVFCQWIQNTPLGLSVHNSVWEWPVIETIHLFGLIMLVGAGTLLDMRLLNLAFKDESVSDLAHRYLPWMWSGFGIQVVTGLLLFSSEAVNMYGNPAFRLKMIMLLLAGLNALVFHVVAYRSVERWDRAPLTPFAAKCAGVCSILLWVGVVVAGRWIPYV